MVCVAVLPLIPGTVLGSDILEQKFEGIVVPRLWVQVVPQVDGVISRLLVVPGQRVSKGDILFEMDPEAFAIDVRIAQSELAEARARLTMAEDAAERQAELVKQNATAKQLARSSQIEVEIARAIVARNESALAKAQLALSRTRVAAPLSGTVGRPRVAPGAFVEATAGTVLAEIAQLDPILAYLSEEDVYRCPAGEKLAYHYTQRGERIGSTPLLDQRLSELRYQTALHHRQRSDGSRAGSMSMCWRPYRSASIRTRTRCASVASRPSIPLAR